VGGTEQNMAGYFIDEYSLVFDVCLKKKPENTVEIILLCTYPCQDKVDITNELNGMAIGKWKEIRIPLQQFRAVDFRKISTKFQIGSTGAVDLDIANIRWEK